MNFSKTLATDCLWLANQAYNNNPENCYERGLMKINVLFSTDSETILYYNLSKKAIIVSFRGSSSKIDFITDLKFYKKKFFSEKNLKVHAGFLDAYIDVITKDNLSEQILNAIKTFGVDKIVFTGHSLGGALSVIAYSDFYNVLNSIGVMSRVITFGQPMVFCKEVLEYNMSSVKTLKTNLLRIVNGRDLVSRLPPRFFGYIHIGKVLDISNNEFDFFGIKSHLSKSYMKKMEKEFVDLLLKVE